MKPARKRIVMLILLWMWVGPLAAQVEKPLVPAATIPFEWHRGLIYLQIEVDSLGHFPFLFDTGTPGSFLYRDEAVAMGLPIKKQKRQLHERDSLDYGKVKRLTYRLSGIQLPVRSVTVFRRTHFPLLQGRHCIGVIGTDLLDAFVVEVDYAQQQLRLFDRSTYEAGEAFYAIDCKTYKGTPVLPIRLEEGAQVWEHRVALHTGFNGTLALSERTARKFDHYEPYPDYLYGYDIILPGHFYPRRKVSLEELQMVGITYRQVPIDLVRREKSLIFRPYWMDGIVGNELLSLFTWAIDIRSNTLYVKPRPDKTAPQRIISWHGMRFTTNRSQERLLVYDVLPNSPAEKAGIRPGDEIIALYDTPFSTLSLAEVEAMLSGSKKKVQVYVKQGKTIYDKIFRLQPMYAPGAASGID